MSILLDGGDIALSKWSEIFNRAHCVWVLDIHCHSKKLSWILGPVLYSMFFVDLLLELGAMLSKWSFLYHEL